jgi:UDP-N-acetylglucosamine 2-epimerase (non-hydrolysing)
MTDTSVRAESNRNVVAILIGTRPEAIKMAPVIAALKTLSGVTPVVISTGQHREMLAQVVDLFGIQVDHDLAVMTPGQSLASLTSKLMLAVDDVLGLLKPSMLLGQGDTTSVLVGALAAFYRHVPFGHVEAGLRTGNLASPFPEEANRKLTTGLATLHFAPTEMARQNLLREEVPDDRIVVTGNTVIDALYSEVQRQQEPGVWSQINSRMAAILGDEWMTRPYVLITGHRRENFGLGFENICGAIAELATRFQNYRFIYPVHLNPNVAGPVQQMLGTHANVVLIPPQDYRHFVALMRHSTLILSDSGGVQEEAPSLNKPVLVMRDTTERPEGLEAGTMLLVGANKASIIAHVTQLLTDQRMYERMAQAENPYGDGIAASRIASRVAAFLGLKDRNK